MRVAAIEENEQNENEWKSVIVSHMNHKPSVLKVKNPILQGWQQYYGRFHGSAMSAIWQHMNAYLIRWMRRKYKNLARHKRRARYALGRLARDFPNAFVHWKMGCLPSDVCLKNRRV